MPPLLPEEIATAIFRETSEEGYDRGEVRAFLQEVAADYAAAIEKLVRVSEGAPQLDLREEANAILRAVEQSANEVLRRSQNEAEDIQRLGADTAQLLVAEAAEIGETARDSAADYWAQVAREAEDYAVDLHAQTETECSLLIEETRARLGQVIAYDHRIRNRLAEIEALLADMRKQIVDPSQKPATEVSREGVRPN
jgi:DivIVA domain-containing protein